MLIMTTEQRAVMAHVVIDPDKWLADAVDTLGETRATVALAKKIARWQPSYDQAASQPGYLPRADRPEQLPAELVD
jgi:hypothetical protein